MSANQTPDRQLRILTDDEYERAYSRLRSAAFRHGSELGASAAQDVLTETLAAADVFLPAPAPEPQSCTALYLPHDPEQFGPDMLGVWQQCADETGHGVDHDSGDMSWSDSMPGAVPATGAEA